MTSQLTDITLSIVLIAISVRRNAFCPYNGKCSRFWEYGLKDLNCLEGVTVGVGVNR